MNTEHEEQSQIVKPLLMPETIAGSPLYSLRAYVRELEVDLRDLRSKPCVNRYEREQAEQYAARITYTLELLKEQIDKRSGEAEKLATQWRDAEKRHHELRVMPVMPENVQKPSRKAAA